MIPNLQAATTLTTTGPGQRMRGSSDLHGWLDSALYFERIDENRVKVEFESRFAAPHPEIEIAIVETPESVKWVVAESGGAATVAPELSAEDRVIAALRSHPLGLDRDGLAAATGMPVKRLSPTLTILVQSGKVRKSRGASKGGRCADLFSVADRDGAQNFFAAETAPIGMSAEEKKSTTPEGRGEHGPAPRPGAEAVPPPATSRMPPPPAEELLSRRPLPIGDGVEEKNCGGERAADSDRDRWIDEAVTEAREADSEEGMEA